MTKTHSPLMFAWFGLVLIASVGLYRTSDHVQKLDRQLHQLNASIENEQQTLHVLKAEWIYLSNPARLETVARKHLALRPTALQQIALLDQVAEILPARGAVASDHVAAKSATAAAKSVARAAASVKAQNHTAIATAKPVAPPNIRSLPPEQVAAPTGTAAAFSLPAQQVATTTADKGQDARDNAPAQTASAQPLPDSIGALLNRVDARP